MVGVFILSIVATGLVVMAAALWSAGSGGPVISAVFFGVAAVVAWLAWRQLQSARVAAGAAPVTGNSVLRGLWAFLVEWRTASTWGARNPAIVCAQCQERGAVRTKAVERKKGISGGKATGAILTGGLSLLVTGLSRKEGATQARCGNCGSIWDF